MRKFSSKVILFGEYAALKGGDALILPFRQYAGALENTGLGADAALISFCDYLLNSKILGQVLETRQFQKDVKSGLRFVSNIPQGMGLGSSGALCAAVYSKYAKSKIVDLPLLREYLAIMESHFHGRSSGIDPLVSYVDRPLHVRANQELLTIDAPDLKTMGVFYLYNSKIQRQTAPLVHNFLKDYSEVGKRKHLDDYCRLSNICIEKFLNEDKSFRVELQELSHLQLRYFSKMIPNNVRQLWKEYLEKEKLIFKLCGAGGGGFFIAHAPKEVKRLKDAILIS